LLGRLLDDGRLRYLHAIHERLERFRRLGRLDCLSDYGRWCASRILRRRC